MAEYIEDEDLYRILANINRTYGSLTIDALKKAHKADPITVPSYKTFERRFGGIKDIDMNEVNKY